MQTRRSRPTQAAVIALFAVATTVSGALFSPDVFAQDGRESSLRAAEQERFAAQVTAHKDSLDALLDDGLEYVHSNGELDTKQSFIDSLLSGKRDYVSTVATIESIRFFGNVAVIRGKAKVTVADNGQSKDLHIGYTDVWLWKDGRWQMTAWRSARLPDSPVK